jgi:hypothetical protein
MFERILLSPSHASRFENFDIGALAECLIFYKKCIITQHFSGFIKLIKTIGIDNFLRLVADEHIEFKFIRQQPAAAYTSGVHDFRLVSLGVRDDFEHIEKALFRATERKGRSKRAASQVMDKIEFIDIDVSLSSRAREVVLDSNYLEVCIPRMLSAYAPTYPLSQGCSFEVQQIPEGFLIRSDINFTNLNSNYRQCFPEAQSNITEDFLLLQFQESLLHANLASKYDSAIISDPAHKAILTSKIQSLIESSGLRMDEATLFQDAVLDSGRSVREIVNSGERTLQEVFEILPQARRFQNWATGIESDQNLIREYFSSINSIGWINSLPAKIVRLSVATGLGLWRPEVGIIASGLDMFLIEKLRMGWKPNMFIQDLDCFTTSPQRF